MILSRAEIDVDLCLSCGQVFRFARTDTGWQGHDGEYVYRFSAERDGWRVVTEATEDAIRRFLGIDDRAIKTIDRLCVADPGLAHVFLHADLKGLRLFQPSSSVETVFSFLCTSNNHLPRITKMVASLASFGQGGKFPSVDRIAAIEESDLRHRGFGYRAATIPLAARQILERGGESWLTQISGLPLPELHRELRQLAGVGPKLADCIALFALHRGDAVPVDVHMWRAATDHLFPEWCGTNLTAAKYEAVGDELRTRFGDDAGAAHQFLFVHQLRRRSGTLRS